MDVKVYAVGIGDRTPGVGRRVNEATLQMFEDITGGQYFYASDTSSLSDVYAAIDELERSRIEQEQYTDFREVALEPFPLGGTTVPPLLVLSMIVLLCERVLTGTRLGGMT